MSPRMARGLPLIGMAVASFALVVGITLGPGDRFIARKRRAPWSVTLASPAGARVLSLGHEELAADWYWVSGIQYYGQEVNRPVFYRDLHLYIDQVNALDPDFEYPYDFGAVSVPYHTGGWKWANVPESTAIIQRGLEQFPDKWKLLMQLGFNLGVIGSDLRGAASAYQRAAALPNAPLWLGPLVARLLVTANDLAAASAYCRSVLERSDDPALREAMESRLLEIETEAIRRELQKVVDAYKAETGHLPEGLEELVKRGRLSEIPPDPIGGVFKLDTNGEVYSTSLWKGVLRIFDDKP